MRISPPKTLALILTLGWIAIFSTLAFNFHAAMRSNRSDLGQIDQAVWNSSQGRFLENTDAGFIATRLTDHVEPILVLISPIFWLWNDVRALLLLQVVAVAVGALFIYAIAEKLGRQGEEEREQGGKGEREKGGSRNTHHAPRTTHFPLVSLSPPLLVCCLLVCFLLAPQLQHAVLTEFHAAPLAVPLILWALWAVEARRTWHFVVAAILVALVKEEMAIAAAGLGVWALYRNAKYEIRNTKYESLRIPYSAFRTLLSLFPYLLVSLSALLWFAIATFVIVPANAPLVYDQAQSVYFDRFGPLGNSPISIVKTLLTDPVTVWGVLSEPARLNYLWGLLAPFGFLSLLAPELLIVALPLIIANVFSTYPGQYYNEFHYSAPIVPNVAVSAIIGAQRLLFFAKWLLGKWGDRGQGRRGELALSTAEGSEKGGSRDTRYALRTTHFLLVSLSPCLLVWLLGWSLHEYIDHGRGPFGGRYDPIVVTAHDRLLERFVAQIPVDAALAATSAVHPHVSHRRYVYQLPLGLDAPVPADWLLIDVTSKTEMAPGDLKAIVDRLLAADWGVVDGQDGFLLLRKGGSGKQIPDAFYDFARGIGIQSESLAKAQSSQSIAQRNIDVADWARWRETSVIFTAPSAVASQGFQILAPDGAEVYNNGVLPTPAQSWYMPSLWQPGESIRLTTLPLYLPRAWGVVSQNEAVASYLRTDGKTLVKLSDDLSHRADFGEALHQQSGWPLRSKRATLRAADVTIQLHSWLRDHPTWRGDKLDLWLQWAGTKWPAGWTVFVHLRKNDSQGGGNAAQADGTPRWFVELDAGAEMGEFGQVNEWRQLEIPEESRVGETYTLVVGLYDSGSGQRADLLDDSGASIGNEFVVGEVIIADAPLPDQTCAMIAQSCAAQQ